METFENLVDDLDNNNGGSYDADSDDDPSNQNHCHTRSTGSSNRQAEHEVSTSPTGRPQNAPRHIELANPVTLQEMQDGIVDTSVYSRYCNEIILFASWSLLHEPDWFTDFGRNECANLQVLHEGERKVDRRKRIKCQWLLIG